MRVDFQLLDLNASGFLGAATNLARLHELFKSLRGTEDPLVENSVKVISVYVESFKYEANNLGARLSVVAAERLLSALNANPCEVNVGQAVAAIDDIESRFADYLVEIKMFALSPQEASFLESADFLIELEGFSVKYPSAAFEVEEAAKCIALGRYTASVFHAMRALEVGIKALSARLGIPNPTKPAEKNWGLILKAIDTKIDELWPRSSRLSGTEGAAFEELHASLDAVRNPWRNATMHVETIYAPHEALHIIRCSAFFLRKLSGLCDEQGNPPPDPTVEDLAV